VLHSRAVTNNLTQKNGNKNNIRNIYLLYQQVKQRINETFPFVDDCKGTDKKKAMEFFIHRLRVFASFYARFCACCVFLFFFCEF